MGGSSTQLIFYTGDEHDKIISPDNFWSHSWLNFGVERVRDKVQAYLISEDHDFASEEESAQGLKVLHNPCAFRGYELEANEGLVVRGTGDGRQCIEVIKEVIWPGNQCWQDDLPAENSDESTSLSSSKRPCYVDGIEHPPIRGHFYGMSVYFFAIDCVRHLGSTNLHTWFVTSYFSSLVSN